MMIGFFIVCVFYGWELDAILVRNEVDRLEGDEEGYDEPPRGEVFLLFHGVGFLVYVRVKES